MNFILMSFFLSICAIIEGRIVFIFSILTVGIFFSVTYGYGYDWINYRDTYIHCLDPNADSFFIEPGLFYLMKIFKYFGFNFSVFMFFVNALMYFMVYLFCRRLKQPCLAFLGVFSLLGFFVFSEWIRQGLAICIVMLAIKDLQNNKKKFYFYVLIACCFHLSSVLCFFYRFLINFKASINKSFFIFSTLLVTVIIFGFYNSQYFSILPLIGEKLRDYGEIAQDVNGGFWDYVLSSRIILIYFLMLFMLYYKRNKSQGLYSSCGSIYFIILSRLSPSLIRLGYFFVPSLVYSVDDYMYMSGKGSKTKVFKLLYIFLLFSISTIPLWNPLFWEGAKTHLYLSSDEHSIDREIGNKCRIINFYSVQHTILRCE